MVKYIVPAQHTWLVRGSSAEHPNAVDFGWLTSVAGSKNQPLYAGVYGADECKVARIRSLVDGGNVIDIRVETPTNTIYLSYMHMQNPSPLAVGTSLNWDTVVGNMGTTGTSTGEHVHIIMAVCPKGTPVDRMYDYRVDPKPYFRYLEGWTNASDNAMPWTNLDGDSLRQIRSGDVLTFKDSTGKGVKVMTNQTYKVKTVNGSKVELELISEEKPTMVGKKVTIKSGTTLYDKNGKAYPKQTTNQHTVTISEDLGTLLGFSASWLVGVSKAYIKK